MQGNNRITSLASVVCNPNTRDQRQLLWLLWITYASFYFGRVNLSVAIPGVMDSLSVTRTEVGFIGAAFFWAYAAGQFVNGRLGDRFGAGLCLTLGLGLSSVMNLMFAFGFAVTILSFIWGLNGWAQSLGWPSTVKTMAAHWSCSSYGRIAGLLGTSYIIGSAVSVVLAGYICKHKSWQWTFLVPCVILAIAAFNWNLRYQRVCYAASYAGKSERPKDDPNISVRDLGDRQGNLTSNSHSVYGKHTWIAGFTLFFVNIVRYGFLMWAPTYIFETAHSNISEAAYAAALLPIAGSIGAASAGWISDRLFNTRRTPVIMIFLFLAGSFAWVYRFVIPVDEWGLGLLILSVIGFVLYGAHFSSLRQFPLIWCLLQPLQPSRDSSTDGDISVPAWKASLPDG